MRLALSLAMLVALLATPARASDRIDLGQALAEALAANARLPVARIEAASAAAREAEARAALGPRVDLEGVLRSPINRGYGIAIGEDRLQIVARQPIFQGGELRGAVRAAQAQFRAARLRLRVDERDVELEVRTRYAEMVAAGETLATHDEFIERLTSYRDAITAQNASGRGLGGDRLRTEVQLVAERAERLAAAADLARARAELNDLLGRQPAAPLEVEPLPPPEPTALVPAQLDTPEIGAALEEIRAAEAQQEVARAARWPHLDLMADIGVLGTAWSFPLDQPGWWGTQTGASVGVNLTWRLFDLGTYGARIEEARLALDQARARFGVTSRQADLSLVQAELALAHVASELEARLEAVPAARDSWLMQESLYRGGAATGLDVLDAASAWRDAALALTRTTLAYRTARAQQIRWSTP